MQKWKRQLFSPKLAEGSDKDTFRISFRNGFLFLKKQFITFSVGADDIRLRTSNAKRENGRGEGDVEGEEERERQKGYFG